MLQRQVQSAHRPRSIGNRSKRFALDKDTRDRDLPRRPPFPGCAATTEGASSRHAEIEAVLEQCGLQSVASDRISTMLLRPLAHRGLRRRSTSQQAAFADPRCPNLPGSSRIRAFRQPSLAKLFGETTGLLA